MKCEKVFINTFIDCWFNKDFTNLSKDDFDICYAEYIDLSGLYHSKEFELYTYINYLKNRIFVLKTVLQSQRLYMSSFGKPYVKGFFIFKSFGYSISWNEDEEDFNRQLDKIASRERQKSGELRRKEFEFNQIKEARKNEEQPLIQSRHDFIKMLNAFNKNGYRIDREKTTVEELALIIKQIQDDAAKFALTTSQRR
jgi:hypothetical protein